MSDSKEPSSSSSIPSDVKSSTLLRSLGFYEETLEFLEEEGRAGGKLATHIREKARRVREELRRRGVEIE